MPLDQNDPYYNAEFVPSAIGVAVRDRLCAAYRVPLDHFGAKGNTSHTSGYHRSRDWCLWSLDSRYGAGDYSVVKSRDKGGPVNACCAFDFTPGEWGTADNRAKMVTMTQRLVAAAQARDPRLANVREFAGTLDGKTVVTYDLGQHAFKTPFDSSHLDHVHVSIFRDAAAADHTGVVDVMLGGPVGTPPNRGENEMFPIRFKNADGSDNAGRYATDCAGHLTNFGVFGPSAVSNYNGLKTLTGGEIVANNEAEFHTWVDLLKPPAAPPVDVDEQAIAQAVVAAIDASGATAVTEAELQAAIPDIAEAVRVKLGAALGNG